jgi:hypothetical protein
MIRTMALIPSIIQGEESLLDCSKEKDQKTSLCYYNEAGGRDSIAER